MLVRCFWCELGEVSLAFIHWIWLCFIDLAWLNIDFLIFNFFFYEKYEITLRYEVSWDAFMHASRFHSCTSMSAWFTTSSVLKNEMIRNPSCMNQMKMDTSSFLYLWHMKPCRFSEEEQTYLWSDSSGVV